MLSWGVQGGPQEMDGFEKIIAQLVLNMDNLYLNRIEDNIMLI